MAALAEAITALREALHHKKPIVVMTGAGVSKESGIPTFRDAQTGLWAQYNPEDLATRRGFLQNPTLVWQWYDVRRNKVWDVAPNAGHKSLVTLESLANNHGSPWTLITQNIDGLHRQAGSTEVLELHGNIFRFKCLDNNHPAEVPADHDPDSGPPQCPRCGSLVRPDVVWFGENLDPGILSSAFSRSEGAAVMIVAGTSGVVQPAASMPVSAKNAGAFLIEINPEPTELTWIMDVSLKGPSAQVLPQLINGVQGEFKGH